MITLKIKLATGVELEKGWHTIQITEREDRKDTIKINDVIVGGSAQDVDLPNGDGKFILKAQGDENN